MGPMWFCKMANDRSETYFEPLSAYLEGYHRPTSPKGFETPTEPTGYCQPDLRGSSIDLNFVSKLGMGSVHVAQPNS